MNATDIIAMLAKYLPMVVTAASAVAATVPPSTVTANPALKTVNAIIDFLALNFGNAKKGPPPLSIMSEVVTGKPALERTELHLTQPPVS